MGTLENFRFRIDAFVDSKLNGYIPEETSDKTIHDTIWGSVVYYGWEIQLIDSPLFQRLRDIRQVGRGEVAYPSAHHTRFEHSLGVIAIASRMIDKLTERSAGLEITKTDKYKVRLAALLHDVGHCFYSHLSENVYGNSEEFLNLRAILEKDFDAGVHPKPHELFSYMITCSDSLCEFFYNYVDYPDKGNYSECKSLLRECANMIVGNTNYCISENKPTAYAFMTQILNGDFDADKLDYTQRDCYTSGIAMSYGVERFLMKIVLCRRETDKEIRYELAISGDAVTTVEELIFNRNMLYVYMYKHQKVLAAEAAIRDVIHGLVQCGILKHPCDFLELTDSYLNSLENCDLIPYPDLAPKRTLGDMIRSVNRRQLPKRVTEFKLSDVNIPDMEELRGKIVSTALVELEIARGAKLKNEIFNRYVKDLEQNTDEDALRIRGMKKIIGALGFSDYDGYTRIRKKLYDRLCLTYAEKGLQVNFDIFDIHLVFTPLSAGKTKFAVLQKGSTVPTVNSFEYIGKWSEMFNATNYKGYVFINSPIERSAVAEAAFDFINEYNTGDFL